MPNNTDLLRAGYYKSSKQFPEFIALVTLSKQTPEPYSRAHAIQRHLRLCCIYISFTDRGEHHRYIPRLLFYLSSFPNPRAVRGFGLESNAALQPQPSMCLAASVA